MTRQDFIENYKCYDIHSENCCDCKECADEIAKDLDLLLAEERTRVIEKIADYIDYLCFGFKASQGNLVRVDVVKETISKKLEQLKEQSNERNEIQ